MKRLPSAGLDSVDCGSILLDAPQVAAIEEAVKEAQVRGWGGRGTGHVGEGGTRREGRVEGEREGGSNVWSGRGRERRGRCGKGGREGHLPLVHVAHSSLPSSLPFPLQHSSLPPSLPGKGKREGGREERGEE